ncbi:MAG: hypothetical protein QM750_28840 [Rubrivivax sp.]
MAAAGGAGSAPSGARTAAAAAAVDYTDSIRKSVRAGADGGSAARAPTLRATA